MSGKELYNAFSFVDDRYLDIADPFEKESMHVRNGLKRKTLMGLLAAVLAVSLLAATAIAAGWIPGIFEILREKNPQEQALFEAAAQANAEAVPEIVSIPQVDPSKLVLLERYFDGEVILLGYDLEKILPEPVVGVEPQKALLEKIRRGHRMSRVGGDSAEGWMEEPATENGKKYDLKQDAFLMDRMLKGTLSEESYAKAWSLMKEQGYVCIAVRDIWVGDSILINGSDLREAYNAETNAYASRTEYNTELGDCLRLEPLPESVRKLEKVTVTLDIRTSVEYWYMDMDGNGRIYTDSSTVESERISFELERECGK